MDDDDSDHQGSLILLVASLTIIGIIVLGLILGATEATYRVQ